MVYEPGKHQSGRPIANSYVLTTAQDASFYDMVKEVEALIKKEGREGDVSFTNKMVAIGTAFLHCDAAFAEKVKHLPYVGSVNQEHTVHAQQKRPGGPAI
jgi:hypothetical protein